MTFLLKNIMLISSNGNIGQVLNTIELINKQAELEKTLDSAHSGFFFLHTAAASTENH